MLDLERCVSESGNWHRYLYNTRSHLQPRLSWTLGTVRIAHGGFSFLPFRSED